MFARQIFCFYEKNLSIGSDKTWSDKKADYSGKLQNLIIDIISLFCNEDFLSKTICCPSCPKK